MIQPEFRSILEIAWSSTTSAVSVVLVLLYGYVCRWKGVVSDEGESNISKLSTTIFLPCLLFSEVGPLATWDNLKEYWAVVAYSLFFQVLSYIFGLMGVYIFKMPQWIVPCMVFNNATSLPLLLLISLSRTGSLDHLVVPGDTAMAALSRGKVYVLINALVCNLTRFTFGPYMLKDHRINVSHPWSFLEPPRIINSLSTQSRRPEAAAVSESYSESTSLLNNHEEPTSRHQMRGMLQRIRKTIVVIFNPPMLGGVAAILAGIVPLLHSAFFNDAGFLSPFSQSISDLGNLYAVLQMFVLGAHLKSKGRARPEWFSLIYLFTFRFFIMPIISSTVVFGVRKYSEILLDPMFDFIMIIAPVGPPALTLAAIISMVHPDEMTETAVATTIVISYALAPLICVGVTLALHIVGLMHYA